jgi:hypothetical protein
MTDETSGSGTRVARSQKRVIGSSGTARKSLRR